MAVREPRDIMAGDADLRATRTGEGSMEQEAAR
jgi:hypothetical protein